MRTRMLSLGIGVALIVFMVCASMVVESAPKQAKGKQKQAAGKQVKGNQKMERGMKGGMGMKMGMGGRHSKLEMLRPLLMNKKLQTEIGISASQVSQLKTLLLDDEKGRIKAQAQTRILEIDLRELLSDESPNLTKIDAKIDELSQARAAEEKRSIHASLAARKVLTSEQVDKLKTAMRKKMQMMMRGGKQRGNMRGMRQGGKMGQGMPLKGMQPEQPGPDATK